MLTGLPSDPCIHGWQRGTTAHSSRRPRLTTVVQRPMQFLQLFSGRFARKCRGGAVQCEARRRKPLWKMPVFEALRLVDCCRGPSEPEISITYLWLAGLFDFSDTTDHQLYSEAVNRCQGLHGKPYRYLSGWHRAPDLLNNLLAYTIR